MSWELSVYIRNDAEKDYKRTTLDYCEIKPHSSGFDAEYYKKQEVTEDFEDQRALIESRNKRIDFVNDLEKVIDNRYLHISPFCFDDDLSWDLVFKHEIDELYKLVTDKEKVDNLFQGLNPYLDFHYSIWSKEESLARWQSETENCSKYKDWKFILIEFPFEIITNDHNEMLAKMHIYRDFSYERNNLIFFFKEFSIDIITKILDMYKYLNIVNLNICTKIKHAEQQILKEEKVNETIESIVNNF